MLQFPDSYFEDEVRDGFYVPSMIKRAWLRLWMYYARWIAYAVSTI
jgi:hypothetical protein